MPFMPNLIHIKADISSADTHTDWEFAFDALFYSMSNLIHKEAVNNFVFY